MRDIGSLTTTRRFWHRAAVATLLASAGAPSGLTAQLSATAGAGVAFERYSFQEPAEVGVKSLSLLTLPYAARVTPLARLRLDVSGAFARGALVRADDSDATISGLTDTELRASFSPVGRDLLTLSLIFLAPTGHSTHTADEADVAGAIASDLLPFRISNWGSGGALGADARLTVPVTGGGIGVSVGYAVASEFEPLDVTGEELVYRPGDELRAQLGLDRQIGSAAKIALLLSLQRYADDELDGRNLYKTGDRYSAMGSFSFAAGTGLGTVYLGATSRGAGTFMTVDPRETPRQLLVLAGGGARVPLMQWTLVPSADVRLFTRSDDVGNGYIVGLGMGAEWNTGTITLVPAARTRFGELRPVEGSESTVWGGEISFTIRGAGARR